MTFDLHRKLNETKAQIIYHKVAVGTKNALDFQLATYLGYLICEQQREGIHPDYFIVTKDNGFTSLMVNTGKHREFPCALSVISCGERIQWRNKIS